MGFSIGNHPAIGVPPFLEPPHVPLKHPETTKVLCPASRDGLVPGLRATAKMQHSKPDSPKQPARQRTWTWHPGRDSNILGRCFSRAPVTWFSATSELFLLRVFIGASICLTCLDRLGVIQTWRVPPWIRFLRGSPSRHTNPGHKSNILFSKTPSGPFNKTICQLNLYHVGALHPPVNSLIFRLYMGLCWFTGGWISTICTFVCSAPAGASMAPGKATLQSWKSKSSLAPRRLESRSWKNYIGDESKVKTQATRMHCGAIVHLVCCLWPTRCTRLGEKKHKEWEGERLKYVTIQLLGCPILTHSHFFTHVNPSLSSLFHAMLMAFHRAKLSSLIRVQCSSLLARPVFLLLWPSQGGITTLLGTVRH